MKQLISFIFVFIATFAEAAAPTIIALVNNEPITIYELQTRKKMLMVLNDISNPDAKTEQKLNEVALKSLIDEQILFQHANKVGGNVSKEEIIEAIRTIEEKNKMPKDYLLNTLKSQSVDESFKAQIKAELIKMNILSYLSKSVTVSPKEIDAVLLSSSAKDMKISAEIFTTNNKNKKTFDKMQNLRKVLKSCDNIKETLYSSFASKKRLEDEKISILDVRLRTLIKDLNPNKTSNVFETEDGFQLVLVCSKKIEGITSEENNYVTNFLTHKKMSQKAQKFFDDLRKKAYIKIMFPQ